MAPEPTEIRMARLEGAYEQTNERLSDLHGEVLALRTEMRGEFGSVRSEMGGLRSEHGSLRSELKTEIAELRRQMNPQFYWLLTFILGSILVPILRDFSR